MVVEEYIYIYIYSSPHHTTPPPLLPVFTIGLRVSVDVKHHVYFTKRERERERGGGGGERDHRCKQLILWCNYVSHDARNSERLGQS